MSQTSTASSPRKKSLRASAPAKSFRLHWQLYLLLLLPLAWVVIFRYWPMFGLQIAFKNFKISKGFWNSSWVGFKYFEQFLTDYSFKRLITNTVGISMYSLIAGFFPPIILAVALNECRHKYFTKGVQTITYMPHFLSTVVVTSILTQLLSYGGALNTVVKALGGTPRNFLSEPAYFKSIYVWSGVWQSQGYNSIMYLAALAGISPELQEAAYVDGANVWQRIWHVDLPGIIPTAIILLILNTASVLNVGYEKVYLLQNSLNMSASDVISTYVYRVGLVDMNYSFSTAVNLFQSVISLALMAIVNGIARKVSDYSLW
ncbi:MAG: ABC transporter permease [Candidatus Fimadaptatus sp.]